MIAEQAETIDGSWKILSGLPYDFNVEEVGSHHFNVRIDQQPSTPNLHVSLSIVKNGIPQPAHASKPFRLGCTCVQVLL